jgi:hypothetical protein
LENLQPLGVAANSEVLTLKDAEGQGRTEITPFEQGVLQVLQAVVTGLPPKKPFVLALSSDPHGKAPPEPLAAFTTNPMGAAIVNAIGPIRQVTQAKKADARRYLIIVNGKPGELGEPVQVQAQH